MSLWACMNTECPMTVYSSMGGLECPECGGPGSLALSKIAPREVAVKEQSGKLSLLSCRDWRAVLSGAPETKAHRFVWLPLFALAAAGAFLGVFSIVEFVVVVAAETAWWQPAFLMIALVFGAVWLAAIAASIVATPLVALVMMFTVRRTVPDEEGA